MDPVANPASKYLWICAKCKHLKDFQRVVGEFHLLLIMCQRQRSNAAVANGESIKRSQVECTPNFHYALVTGCHEVFTVARQQHALVLEK